LIGGSGFHFTQQISCLASQHLNLRTATTVPVRKQKFKGKKNVDVVWSMISFQNDRVKSSLYAAKHDDASGEEEDES
jgi:hypothetical protein